MKKDKGVKEWEIDVVKNLYDKFENGIEENNGYVRKLDELDVVATGIPIQRMKWLIRTKDFPRYDEFNKILLKAGNIFGSFDYAVDPKKILEEYHKFSVDDTTYEIEASDKLSAIKIVSDMNVNYISYSTYLAALRRVIREKNFVEQQGISRKKK